MTSPVTGLVKENTNDSSNQMISDIGDLLAIITGVLECFSNVCILDGTEL